MAESINLNNKHINSIENLKKFLFTIESEETIDDSIEFDNSRFTIQLEFAFPLKSNGKFDGVIRRIYNTTYYPAFKESEFERLSNRPTNLLKDKDGNDARLISLEGLIGYDDLCLVVHEKVTEFKLTKGEDDILDHVNELQQTMEGWRTIIPGLLPHPVPNEKDNESIETVDYEFGLLNKKTILNGNGVLKLEDGRIIRIIHSKDMNAKARQIASNWMNNFSKSVKLYIAAGLNQILVANHEFYKNSIAELTDAEKEEFHDFEDGVFGGNER